MAEQEKDTVEEESLQNSIDENTGKEPPNQEVPEDAEVSSEAEEDMEADGEEDEPGEDEDSEEDGSGDNEDSEEADGPKTRAEKRAAKKQAKHDKKAEAYREQIEHLEDRVKRQLAEFENFRNRSEKEKHAMFETGAKSVIEKMLPVVDNFERGLATVPEENREDPFVDGMNRVYKQLLTELENIGVKPIEAVGQEFDPALHNAVMQVASEEYESGVVAQELQKGYTYHDMVVRHSMVAVVE